MCRILEVQIHSVSDKLSVWLLVDAGEDGKQMRLFRSFDDDHGKALSCFTTCRDAVRAGAVLVDGLMYLPSAVA